MLSELIVEKGKTTLLTLDVDVSSWFKGIHLTSMNSVVLPSLEALKMADNYMEMFSSNNKTGNQKK